MPIKRTEINKIVMDYLVAEGLVNLEIDNLIIIIIKKMSSYLNKMTSFKLIEIN